MKEATIKRICDCGERIAMPHFKRVRYHNCQRQHESEYLAQTSKFKHIIKKGDGVALGENPEFWSYCDSAMLRKMRDEARFTRDKAARAVSALNEEIRNRKQLEQSAG